MVDVTNETELRDAIFAANAGGDTTINITGNITLNESLPMISSNVTINGGGNLIDADRLPGILCPERDGDHRQRHHRQCGCLWWQWRQRRQFRRRRRGRRPRRGCGRFREQRRGRDFDQRRGGYCDRPGRQWWSRRGQWRRRHRWRRRRRTRLVGGGGAVATMVAGAAATMAAAGAAKRAAAAAAESSAKAELA